MVPSENAEDWTLEIKHVTAEDDAEYECQVNSDPKMSRKVFLKVKGNKRVFWNGSLDIMKPYFRE